jgi:hypothetical protein
MYLVIITTTEDDDHRVSFSITYPPRHPPAAAIRVIAGRTAVQLPTRARSIRERTDGRVQQAVRVFPAVCSRRLRRLRRRRDQILLMPLFASRRCRLVPTDPLTMPQMQSRRFIIISLLLQNITKKYVLNII